MQASVITALRGLMMLLSLVAVPLAAVIGSGSWPRVQEKLLELRQQIVAKLDPAPRDMAPGTMSLGGEPLRPLTIATTDPTGFGPIARENTSPGTAPAVATPPPIVPQGNQPIHFDPQTRPASFEAAVAPEPSLPPVQTPAPDVPVADRVGWIQHRLQTLGAAWYRLETAGGTGEMFRFQCKMTSPTNPNYVRYFEATSGEPVRSMQHVLDQIDAWVASREPAG